MPWFFPWTDTIKKKVCRYLLNKFLGNFLEHKISLDQLTVDFYNGTGTLEDIQLYCQVSGTSLKPSATFLCLAVLPTRKYQK
jgi:N-terminal region of Chorein or VPS13